MNSQQKETHQTKEDGGLNSNETIENQLQMLNSDEKINNYFHLKYNEPPLFPEKKINKYLLIRHAFSEFNFILEGFFLKNPTLERMHPAISKERSDPQYLDCPLHRLGIEQCLSNRVHVNQVDTNLVLISPLQRTLQTAITLFSLHPQRHKIRFLIHPMISESMNNSCCVSNKIYSKMREQYINIAKSYDINLDFSILDDKTRYPSQLRWQIDQMENDELKERVKDINNEEEYGQYVCEEMRKNFPKFFEDWTNLIARAQKFKKELTQIISQEEKTVCVVSHCNFIQCLTQDGYDDKGYVKGLKLNNCQMSYCQL